MQVAKLSLKMLARNKKQGIEYGGLLLIATVIIFVFGSLLENRYLIGNDQVIGSGSWRYFVLPLSLGLPFGVILFCCYMVMMANECFLYNHNSEFAILEVNGVSVFGVTKYYGYQVLAILGLVTVLDFIFGNLLTILVNYCIYSYLNIEALLFDLSFSDCFNIVAINVILFLVIVVNTCGFLFRYNLQELLKRSFSYQKVKRRHRYFFKSAIILYLVGLVLIGLEDKQSVYYLGPVLIGMLGLLLMIKQSSIKIIRMIKEKFHYRLAVIYLSRLAIMLQKVANLFVVIVIMAAGLIPIFIVQGNYSNEFVTNFLAFLAMMFLLIMTVVFKLVIYINDMKFELKIIWLLGIKIKEIIKIMHAEVGWFYSLLVALPMSYVAFIGYRLIVYHDLNILLFIILVLAYLILIMMAMLVTNCIYRRQVIKEIEG